MFIIDFVTLLSLFLCVGLFVGGAAQIPRKAASFLKQL